ncbi:MAG: hypothetical protein NTY38_30110, partial [Acidobacteria bacterium]|nr:hypothetical protein [Acidobacteriota bacterium]
MVWLLLRGIEGQSNRAVALAALAGGAVCLAGHFQTALYLMTALGFCGAAFVWQARGANWRRVVLAMAAMVVASALLSAVETLPSAELVVHSLRSRLSATEFSGGILTAKSLATYVAPNAAGAFHPVYTGPQDLTQHYFFAGTLLLALALAGLWFEKERRVLVLALVAPAL